MPFEMITFTDPERDLDGRIVGLKTRPVYSAPQPDEEVWKKKTLKGGHPGLTLSLGWRERAERDGWLLVVEGASDVIAAHHAGLAVSGRPSKDGGFELVARLFATLPGVLPVIACENDRKPDGSWPGKVGERYANKLAGELGRDGVRRPARRREGLPSLADRPGACAVPVARTGRETSRAP